MIQPVLEGEAFLRDLAVPLGSAELRLWWLGQSGFLLGIGNQRLLLDPYLSDSLTRKYADTDKPHTRLTARVIAPELLTGITAITSSHNHTDHLDAETLLPLLAANPGAKLIIPEANRSFVADRLGIAPELPVGLDAGQSATVGQFEIHGIPAAHNDVDRDEVGHHRYLGYVVRCGGWTLYHSGDTLLHAGLVNALAAFAPIDIAFLPINGNKPERRVAGNLDGTEAAQLAHEIGTRWVIPCHYEMFAFNTADPQELFVPECQRLGQAFRLLRAGEGWTAIPSS